MRRSQKIVGRKASCEGIVGEDLRLGLPIILLIALLGLISTAAPAGGAGKPWHPRACSKTASSAFLACQYEVRDDYWIAKGNCYNLPDEEVQAECFAEAKEEYKEAREECRDQLEARKDLCDELGEAAYDPEIDPNDFVDPTTINSATANPYFSLVQGNTWEYEGGDETITVSVTGETKEILGVTCRVVTDVVEVDGETTESTKDWYAQDTNGNVWYFGEISQEFEDGELISIDGSWTAGTDGAKPGIIMFADPLPPGVEVGTVFRQEFALGDAEDAGEVVGLNETVTVRGTAYSHVRKTRDFTPLEPEVFENKYYAPGVGVILEEAYEDGEFTGEVVELVNFIPGS